VAKLEDILDPEVGLLQDDWSIKRPSYGENGKLQVVGWSGRACGAKLYICYCPICANDKELWGGGYFKSIKSNLQRGTSPCGCGRPRFYSSEQYNIRCRRAIESKNPKWSLVPCDIRSTSDVVSITCSIHSRSFKTTVETVLSKKLKGYGCPECRDRSHNKYTDKDVIEKVKGSPIGSRYELVSIETSPKLVDSRITFNCSIHGVWDTSYYCAVYIDVDCPQCVRKDRSERMSLSDEYHIEKFKSTGVFVEGTSFKKIDRKDAEDRERYWEVTCPTCNTRAESSCTNLRAGVLPCECGASYKIGYINRVFTEDGEFIKFGITKNLSRRIHESRKRNRLVIENIISFVFDSKIDCLKAEMECKNKVISGVVNRDVMPDGWTETTFLENLEVLVDVSTKFGGKVRGL
jgi:hypothetical protein